MLPLPGATNKEVKQHLLAISFLSGLARVIRKQPRASAQILRMMRLYPEKSGNSLSETARQKMCIKWEKQSGLPGSLMPALSLP